MDSNYSMVYRLFMADEQIPKSEFVACVHAALRKAVLRILFLNEQQRLPVFELKNLVCRSILRNPMRFGLKRDVLNAIKTPVESKKHYSFKDMLMLVLQDLFDKALHSLNEENIIFVIEDNKEDWASLTNRMEGSPVSRYENMLAEVKMTAGVYAAHLVDMAQAARYSWATSTETLVVEGLENVSGAVLFPWTVKVSPSGVRIDDAVLVVARSWGHLHWVRIRGGRGWKGKNACFRLEQAPGTERRWLLRLRLDERFLANNSMQVKTLGAKMLPKTSVSKDVLPSDGVRILVRDCAEILRKSGDLTIDARWFGARLRGRTWKQHLSIANWLVGSMIPAEAISSARRFPSCSAEQWSILFPKEPEAAQRRTQFLRAFPGLYLSLAPKVSYLPRLLACIDDGGQPLRLLSREVGVDMPVLRSIAAVPWQRLISPTQEMGNLAEMQGRLSSLLSIDSDDNDSGVENGRIASYHNLSSGMREKTLFSHLLREMPPEWHPRSRQDWYALASLSKWASLINLDGVLEMATSIVRAHKGAWSAVSAEIAALAFPNECNDTLAWLQCSLDDVMGLRRGIDRIVRTNQETTSKLLSLLFAGKPWRAHGMSEISGHWHGAAHLLAAETTRICAIGFENEIDFTKPNVKDWDTLSESDSHSLEGGQATWLTSETMLRDETDRMIHCVWSYGNACMERGSHIASISGQDGSRSTLELSISAYANDDGYGKYSKHFFVKSLQHRGYNNKIPSQSCVAVADALMALCADIPQERLAMLVKACQERHTNSQNWLNHSTGRRQDIVDVDSAPQREAMLRLMDRFIHRKWRGMGLDDFCAAIQPALPGMNREFSKAA